MFFGCAHVFDWEVFIATLVQRYKCRCLLHGSTQAPLYQKGISKPCLHIYRDKKLPSNTQTIYSIEFIESDLIFDTSLLWMPRKKRHEIAEKLKPDEFTTVHWLRHGRIPYASSWWRHQMETFSALLAICAGNSPVPGEFPTQRPVTRSFDVCFDLCLNKRLSKQSWGWWFETLSCPLWRHNNAYNDERLVGYIDFSCGWNIISYSRCW